MLADYNFYKNEYKGIVFADSNSYEYYGERASEELAPFSYLQNDEESYNQLKRCACRIADVLHSKQADGKSISSESVAGYYSVSYSNIDEKQIKSQINTAIKLYIGKYILGAKKVSW